LAGKDQSLLVQCLGKLAMGGDVPPNDTKISLTVPLKTSVMLDILKDHVFENS